MYDAQTPESICALFAKIAKDYDRANSVLSLGLFRLWNQQLIAATSTKGRGHLIDLCAGTGDIALKSLQKKQQSQATLLDFCPEMLACAKEKAYLLHVSEKARYICADAQRIPFDDCCFDAASIAYGIRNVKEPHACFCEIYRTLKAGACVGVLELTRPGNLFLKMGHKLYLKSCVPLLGKLVASDRGAYEYLSGSIAAFRPPQEVAALMQQSGFQQVRYRSLTGGIATLTTGVKPL